MQDSKKSIYVCQSNYLPWKGYFDAINTADEFIIYDEMQYTKNDWRNRNKIKTPQGTQWITIPIRNVRLDQKINETEVANQLWRKKHWNAIKMNYSRAPFFKDYEALFEFLYLKNENQNLSEINQSFIEAICKTLSIETVISRSKNYDLKGDKNERLVNICRQAKAEIYYSGPAAKNYMDTSIFEKNNIEVRFLDYRNYPEYDQLYNGFEHQVTILDLLFNMGSKAPDYMKAFNKITS